MVNPQLWASTPHNNPNAFADMLGQVELFHRALSRTTGYTVLPIGAATAGVPDGLQEQAEYAARALGVGPVPDLETYNLADPGDWASWTFQLGQFHRALQLAAGIP